MEMLEDHNNEWLENFDALPAVSFRETILIATSLDINKLSRGGVTVPKSLGSDLVVAELIDCLKTAIDWVEIYGVKMSTRLGS